MRRERTWVGQFNLIRALAAAALCELAYSLATWKTPEGISVKQHVRAIRDELEQQRRICK